MSVETEITRIKDNISNAYTKLEEKGATIPEEKNSNNLPSTIETITGGGGGGGDIYSELWNLRTENNTNWTRLFNYYGSISDGYTEADLTEIIKKLDSSSVKYMINTFYYGYFKSGTVPNVDILNFDSLEDGSSAFERMDTKYTNFQLGDFSFPKAKILNGTFQGNYYLTKIGKIIAPLCEDFQYCFSYCRALETIEEINIRTHIKLFK